MNLLIRTGVNLNIQDKYGLTPLHFGNFLILRFQINMCNVNCYLSCGLKQSQYYKCFVIDKLINAGANLSIQASGSFNEWTALHFGKILCLKS